MMVFVLISRVESFIIDRKFLITKAIHWNFLHDYSCYKSSRNFSCINQIFLKNGSSSTYFVEGGLEGAESEYTSDYLMYNSDSNKISIVEYSTVKNSSHIRRYCQDSIVLKFLTLTHSLRK